MALRGEGHAKVRSLGTRITWWAALAVALSLCLPAALAAPTTSHRSAATSRPMQSVAYARIAVVRVLTFYNGSVSGDPVPTPSPSPCASDGVLVGTTGSQLNALNYILTPTAAVSPTNPCQGAQAAFQQLYGRARSWTISHIDVCLNVAYLGTSDTKCDTAPLASIDPSQIRTNGGASAPALQVVALTLSSGAATHDLPVLSVPQPSDAPVDPAQNVVLDLTGGNGQLLGRDSVTQNEVATTLFPVDLSASTVGAVQPTTGATGGTPAPTAVPLDTRLSVGTPLIDANGRLVGMVVSNANGVHSLASVADLTRVIGPVTSKPGPLMTQWQQGLSAYYANPAQFSDANTAFAALASAYPDFGGVNAFLTASQSSSLNIPSLTTAPGSLPGSNTPTNDTGLSKQTLIVVVSLAFAALVLLIVATVVLLRRRRTRVPRPVPIPPEEAALDLLPRDMPLDLLDDSVDMQATVPLPALPADIAAMTTLQIPAVKPEPIRRSRTGLALLPLAAGRTDAGVRRAGDPNQDNIFVAQGIRVIQGRNQPYGVFIVADGMGGHMNGKEASRLAIEIVANATLQVLTSSNPVDDASLTELLRGSVQHAGAEMHRRNLEEHLDMGTTFTAALVVDDVAYVVNVGDSRTYLMSPEFGLRAVTTDHSVVASLVAAGVIRPDDIYTHPRRNQIYRSLGGETNPVDVDTFSVPIQAGDKMLLCSDGLWEMVRDPQIENILRGTVDPHKAAELLVREANANGGEDNISAVVIRFIEDVPQEAESVLFITEAPESMGQPA